ncbi:hypothetical protein VQ045_01945 [Aurantimonas sp. E1-2-R+4]|uniref:hypothetical protein n=1 Tax=Aurantimonas sp. E1-2-R+4 TaxID=3113714 RepID=UPI002F9546CE
MSQAGPDLRQVAKLDENDAEGGRRASAGEFAQALLHELRAVQAGDVVELQALFDEIGFDGFRLRLLRVPTAERIAVTNSCLFRSRFET